MKKVNSICKNGTNLCCHECPDVGDCKDLWKCEQHIDFYKNCKKQEG
jgi:hypothetical protein